MKSNPIKSRRGTDAANGRESWAKIFSAFPELLGMMTANLDLPSILKASTSGTFRNTRNLTLLRLLGQHGGSLPAVLSGNEKVVSIIPCRLAICFAHHNFIFPSLKQESSDAIFVTTKRILLVIPGMDQISSSWFEIDSSGFCMVLDSHKTNGETTVRLSQGYALIFPDSIFIPSEIHGNLCCASKNTSSGTAPRPESSPIIFQRLCPVCFRYLDWANNGCSYCGEKLRLPAKILFSAFLLPGWSPNRGFTNRMEYSKMALSAILWLAMLGSFLSGSVLLPVVAAAMVAANHFTNAYIVYKQFKLCLIPETPKS